MKSFTRIHIIFAAFFVMAITAALFLNMLLGYFHELPDPNRFVYASNMVQRFRGFSLAFTI